MKLIVAENIPRNIQKALEKENFNLIFTPANINLLSGLEYHPDMQIAKVCGKYICDKSLYTYYRHALGSRASSLHCGDFICKSNYPQDVAYNVKVIKDKIIHNFKYTDSCLLKMSDRLTRVNVTQGYSGCSICSVGENALITADKIIAQKAEEQGIDALLISPGHILLPGFDSGFIGGASFSFNDKVYFFGNATLHPDWSKIADFFHSHKVNTVMLSQDALCDYGSAITID